MFGREKETEESKVEYPKKVSGKKAAAKPQPKSEPKVKKPYDSSKAERDLQNHAKFAKFKQGVK